MEHQLHHMSWLLSPFLRMFFSFWSLLDLASQQEFELTTCSENSLYLFANTPLVKKVRCGVEFCSLESCGQRCDHQSVVSSDESVPTDLSERLFC